MGAYFKAYKILQERGVTEVPLHLRDGNRDAAALGHGAGYKYPHLAPSHHIPQQYLPDHLRGISFYSPSEQGYEAAIKARLEAWQETQRRALGIEETEDIPEPSIDQIVAIKRDHNR